jgi:hypothetical protein
MTGPSLAPLIIPIAGTLFLTAWLALVFYAGRRPQGAAGNPAPAHESPGLAALAAPRLPGASPADMAAPANTRHSRPQRSGDVRVIFEVER